MSKIHDELIELTMLQAALTATRSSNHDVARDAVWAQLDKIVKQIDSLVDAAQAVVDMSWEEAVDRQRCGVMEIYLHDLDAALVPFQQSLDRTEEEW